MRMNLGAVSIFDYEVCRSQMLDDSLALGHAAPALHARLMQCHLISCEAGDVGLLGSVEFETPTHVPRAAKEV